MNGILFAFLGTLFTFFITTCGALGVFCIRKEIGGGLQRGFLGFAGGVMIAASIWSLLLPGITQAEENEQMGWLVVTGGFLLGVFLLILSDSSVRKWYVKQENKPVTLRKSTMMLVMAVTVHNIPEGMAVGLAFALAAQSVEDAALLSGAIALTLGIAIQNFPEGTAVALPLMNEGMSRKKAFLVASMTAIVEPIFGVIAATFVSFFKICIPVFLAFAAGTMIYVVVEELIPQAHMTDGENEGKEGTLGFIVGFLIMMILDVALG